MTAVSSLSCASAACCRISAKASTISKTPRQHISLLPTASLSSIGRKSGLLGGLLQTGSSFTFPFRSIAMPYDSFPKKSVFNSQGKGASHSGSLPRAAGKEEQAADRRLSSPAALRNREHIAEVLQGVLPSRGCVLEIASGTGEHVSLFAAKFPDLEWQPSDIDSMALESIADWVRTHPLSNLHPPVTLNVEDDIWPVQAADVIVNSNMVHISPYSTCEGLMKGAAQILPEKGVLVLYGPFKRNGVHTAVSNEQFDASLRSRDSSWGVRDVAEVAATAEAVGLLLEKEMPMPANNQILIFRKS